MQKSQLSYSNFFSSELKSLEKDFLKRTLSPLGRSSDGSYLLSGNSYLDLASNDYLGLSFHPQIIQSSKEAIINYGTSSSASRLVTGTLELHEELEQKCASWMGFDTALVAGSGYHVNVGVLSSLLKRNDFVFLDKLAHASLIDGAMLSKATAKRFLHNDLNSLEKLLKVASLKRKSSDKFLIVTESIFSMDGDIADLDGIYALALKYNSLVLVDEAHSLGVFGKNGSGVLYSYPKFKDITVCTATFSKSLASYGGLVCCSLKLREYLISKMRSFIFSTALPPASLAAASSAIDLISKSQNLGTSLLEESDWFRAELQNLGLDTMNSSSQIVPLLVGDNKRTLKLATILRDHKILVGAMRSPSVPMRKSRLRFSLNLKAAKTQLEEVISILKKT